MSRPKSKRARRNRNKKSQQAQKPRERAKAPKTPVVDADDVREETLAQLIASDDAVCEAERLVGNFHIAIAFVNEEAERLNSMAVVGPALKSAKTRAGYEAHLDAFEGYIRSLQERRGKANRAITASGATHLTQIPKSVTRTLSSNLREIRLAWKDEVAKAQEARKAKVANLALACLNLKIEVRPSMTEKKILGLIRKRLASKVGALVGPTPEKLAEVHKVSPARARLMAKANKREALVLIDKIKDLVPDLDVTNFSHLYEGRKQQMPKHLLKQVESAAA